MLFKRHSGWSMVYIHLEQQGRKPMRYFIHLSYDGTQYRGWQMQNGVVSVQEKLEESLSSLFKKRIFVGACGRTDAQVHASQFYAHVELPKSWSFDIVFLVNQAMPHDIVVHDVIPMHAGAHAQLDACERQYDYYFHTKRDAFLLHYSSYYKEPELRLEKMEEALEILCKHEDFRALCKSPDKHNHTRCTILSAFIEKRDSRYHFQIKANRFLRGMIRVIVGHLIEIGSGRESLEDFEKLFLSKERSTIFPVAHPQGLYLSKITYPYLDEPAQTNFLEGLF